MIEIVLGLLALTAAASAALGLAEGHLPVPIGLGTAGAVAVLGLLSIAHGLYRIRLKTIGADRHWLRSVGLMWIMLLAVAMFALAVPALTPLLNAFRIAGFPLGYYMASQGSLIALVVLLFIFAWRSDSVDDREGARED